MLTKSRGSCQHSHFLENQEQLQSLPSLASPPWQGSQASGVGDRKQRILHELYRKGETACSPKGELTEPAGHWSTSVPLHVKAPSGRRSDR